MVTTDGAVDHELRQTRLSTFGRVLALMALGYVGMTFSISIWLRTFGTTKFPDRPAVVNYLRASVP